MAVKLLGFGLLLLVPYMSLAKEKKCLKSASNCDECIKSGPECAWCVEPQSTVRCHTSKGLRRAGCLQNNIYNPQGRVEVVRNEDRIEPENTEALFLHPQQINLSLRPGVSQSLPLTIIKPTDQQITELSLDTGPLPTGLNITFSGIENGNSLVAQVTFEDDQCPGEDDDINQKQNLTGPWSVHITPRGSSLSVKLQITLECQCECIGNRERNSPVCSRQGTLVCGRCECNEDYTGPQCQTEQFFSLEESFCRSIPKAPLCSGRGKCVEGFCECETRVNPAERYSGQFCECSDFDCPRYNGRLCGGHGACICGQCVCDRDWTGEGCQCSMETTSCMASNQRVCNNKGLCQCGQCVCQPPYAGPTCEECPFCEGRCPRHEHCVECLAFRTGPKKDRCDQDCGYLNVTLIETEPDFAQLGLVFCKMISREDSCVIKYILPPGDQSVMVFAKKCPRPW